jgi:NAD-dependent SIR2 family protein deacetylase
VDSLHTKAGLPEDKVVEVHGSIAKDNIVLYEDPIPSLFYTRVEEDFSAKSTVDLVLVMGTSLQVAPFCALPNMVPKSCTRALVTQKAWHCFSNSFSHKTRDIEGLYSSYENMSSSWIKLAGRKVTLRPQWVKSKYQDQYILDMNVQRFVEVVRTSMSSVNT